MSRFSFRLAFDRDGDSKWRANAPAVRTCWRVLSDSTGNRTISLILISKNDQNWAANLSFVCFPLFATFVSIFSAVFRPFIRTARFRNLRDVYRTHPTARRDSCGLQPPSASGSTAYPHTCYTSSIFSKQSNLYQLN